MKRKEHIEAFVRVIWNWYKKNKRDLPWRNLAISEDRQRAYQILVSEVMLQQTQVSRVIIKYREFLEMFPTIDALASASNTDVIMAWRGMGYNNRALRLRDCAKSVACEKWDVAGFPIEMNELMALPGIGHYTAAAIRNFAFGIPTACLDTNIRRVLHRAFIGPENSDGTWKRNDDYLLQLSEQVMCSALESNSCRYLSVADWFYALMDYGSLVCTKRNPKWEGCPLTKGRLMKAAYKVVESSLNNVKIIKEPGRFVGSRYIPNRIFRGKIVEELRDSHHGLSATDIGRRVCIDWNPDEHTDWMQGLLFSLQTDGLIDKQRARYMLS